MLIYLLGFNHHLLPILSEFPGGVSRGEVQGISPDWKHEGGFKSALRKSGRTWADTGATCAVVTIIISICLLDALCHDAFKRFPSDYWYHVVCPPNCRGLVHSMDAGCTALHMFD